MSEEKDNAGLTTTEKNIIRNTWELVKKDVAGNGYDLFIRFFDENPTYQQLFKSFKNVPKSELRGNKRVLAHATNVLYAISMLVDNIDDTEVLVEMLKKLATNHQMRHISYNMFENLKITLVGLLKDKLGSTLMNDEAINAWDKTYNVILSVVKPVLENVTENE
ncbi:globin-like [Oppia nitens]|uniref:globin-like n=1 Tax=Oppia nitens TaxID=1686743 RepID=UPI0023DAE71E|nr:globin-like [Oppia nitens]XP_054159277.1 globin-like [Oppia nitens]